MSLAKGWWLGLVGGTAVLVLHPIIFYSVSVVSVDPRGVVHFGYPSACADLPFDHYFRIVDGACSSWRHDPATDRFILLEREGDGLWSGMSMWFQFLEWFDLYFGRARNSFREPD